MKQTISVATLNTSPAIDQSTSPLRRSGTSEDDDEHPDHGGVHRER